MNRTDYSTPIEAFTSWEGGKMPVPSDTKVEVRVRGEWPRGSYRFAGMAGEFRWTNDVHDPHSDIIGYRIELPNA